MGNWMRVLLVAALLCRPTAAAEGEISIAEQLPQTVPSGYTAMVTAGTVGVGASASLLLLTNRK